MDPNDIFTRVRRAPAPVRIAALVLLAITLIVTGTLIALIVFVGM